MRCDTISTDAAFLPRNAPRAQSCAKAIETMRDGLILYTGSMAGAPDVQPERTAPCEGRLITPGLIDCHTHLVHGGNRADEWRAHLNDISHEELAHNAARALSLPDIIGRLEPGKRCDLAIGDVERPADLVYRMGLNSLHARSWSGS